MKGQSVIRRYARALYEAAADASLQDSLEADIEVFNRIFKDAPEIRKYCLSPSRSPEKNRKFIEIALLPYLSDFTGRTVEILCRNNRLEAVPYLADVLEALLDRDRGITKVKVESAKELDESEREIIRSGLEKRIGGPVRADWQIRKGLQGGVTFQWDSRFLDLSLKSRLNSLGRMLKRNAL